jgi:toxin ParE1/3/4
MANRARTSPRTEDDLHAIWRYVASKNTGAADRLLDRIEATFDKLARSPLSGRARPDLAATLRSFPVGSYVIFYVPAPHGITVVRVMHSKRDITTVDVTP